MSSVSRGSSPARGRALRFSFLLLLVVLLILAGWLLLRSRERANEAPTTPPATDMPEKHLAAPAAPPPAPARSGPDVKDARLSLSSKPEVPGPSPARFRSGEEVFLHFRLEQSCGVFVGFLDSSLGLVAVSTSVTKASAGANVLGPFELARGEGREAMVLIASLKPQAAVDFERLLGRANDATRGVEPKLEAKLSGVLAALRAHEGITAEAVELEHLR